MLAIFAATPAIAQYPVQTAQPTGRMLDANPQIGYSRFYGSGPVSPLLGGNLPWSGNLAASGNLRGGMSLRSISPIADPSAFRGPLASSGLSDFLRDSVSVGDSMTPLGALPAQPFFDPSRTAPTAAWLNASQNAFVPRTAAFSSPQSTPRINYPGLINAGRPLDLRMDGTQPAGGSRAFENPLASATMQSTIFSPGAQPIVSGGRPIQPGGAQPISTPGLRDPRVPTEPELTAGPPGGTAPIGQPLDVRIATKPISPLPNSGIGPARPGDPYSMLFDPDSSRIMEMRRDRTLGAPLAADGEAAVRTGSEPGVRGLPDTVAPGGIPQPGTGRSPAVSALRGPTMLAPGRDVFTDLQMSVALDRDPSAPWYAQMQSEVQQSPQMSMRVREMAALQATEFVERALSSPLASFAGEGEDVVNSELRTAEALLGVGQYYESARAFERARGQDPLNPLPMIGKGHALLAAGEYLTAATLIAQGFERFPEMSRFRFDAKALLGGGEILDIRRADLKRRLAEREDAQLRFLLGYIEFYGGRRDEGMSNLRKAAEAAPAGSLIWRLPDMLEGRGLLPPPKLPEGTAVPPAP